MKTLIPIVMACLLLTATPAEAKGRFKRLIDLCTHGDRGPVRKLVGAPFFIAGFTASLIADATVVPFVRGVKHYIVEPAVGPW